MRLCECGCGETPPLARQTNTKRGMVRGEPMRFVYRHQSRVREPIEDKYVVDPATGCWNWDRAQDGHGYGQYLHPVTKTNTHPHRYLYEREFGPIPDGLQIDHLCRNRLCVNPSHMEAVTPRENILRGVGSSAVAARKTHCVRGHEFAPENTHITTQGARACITCRHLYRQTPEFKRKRSEYRRQRYASTRRQQAGPPRG